MNITEIEENLKSLINEYDKDQFIYDFLLAYGLPKASITRLKKGSYDLSDKDDVVSWKRRVLFKEENQLDLHDTITELSEKALHDQRFIIATDFQTLLAGDTQTKENLDIPFKDLPKHYDFFLPWAGMEKTEYQNENPADVKAAERMAKFFDEIKKENEFERSEEVHSLNVFMTRLLFCFFAEDTNIFSDGVFTNSVASHTQADASDLDAYLNKLFEVLNTAKSNRQNLPAYLEQFPYVNGGLFKEKISCPKFTRKSREIIIESGELDWSEINPDIFGSMMQAVIVPEHRGDMGIHYTSVPNIMKVIKPLFLDELYDEFEKGLDNRKKLKELLHRLNKIKIFDPACGSGNFLVIAYKELRRLEMEVLKELGEMALSGITLNQFYGIELDDFAHELAQLSLWLAEHQMNVEFFKEFGRTNPTLPLKEAGNIAHGNACRIEWEKTCPKNNGDEIYILGNPPYLGYSRQSKQNKEDLKLVFDRENNFKKLDYISAWFVKGAKYIQDTTHSLAFVTTNSITQGIQVNLLWPLIIQKSVDIKFAHKSFKWNNNAKANAGVYVVVIGLESKKHIREKFIYNGNRRKTVKNISPYLIESDNLIVEKRASQLSKELPAMVSGIKAGDNGNLILSETEMKDLVSNYPKAEKFIKNYIGAREFMNSISRYCIWVNSDEYNEAKKINALNERFEKLREFRINSKKKATNEKSKRPFSFDENNHIDADSLLIPQTGSKRRGYLPIGFLDSSYVISNAARVIYDAKPWHFGVLSSKMHISWVKAVAGRLKMDMQYSNTLCYNTFPFPKISQKRREEINQCAFRILEEREKHSDKTLAELYDPEEMPDLLLEAHLANDEVIEKCYRSRPFESDEERLEYLFKLYERMIEEEQEKNTLFEKKKKRRR
ncbi:MAG: DNA methyltransferase [Balneola sp.]